MTLVLRAAKTSELLEMSSITTEGGSGRHLKSLIEWIQQVWSKDLGLGLALMIRR